MDPVTAIALAGGTIVAVKVVGQPKEKVAEAKAPVSGAASGRALIKSKQNATPSANGLKNPLVAARASTYLNSNAAAAHPTDAEQAIMDAARKAYDKLSSDAKKAACAKLKSSYPNSPSIQGLDCSASTFQQVLVAAAAAGATAGCVATGVAAAVSPLCGIVGGWIASWAGPKLEEWTKDAYNAVSDKVSDAASEVASDVVSWAGGIW